MTAFLNQAFIQNSINALAEAVNFRLLYDLAELPAKLKHGKDIDILVAPEDMKTCIVTFKRQNFKEIAHPNIADTYIYGAPKRRMFMAQGLYFDVHTKLVVRSLDAGQWLPLDVEIQDAAWTSSSSSVAGAPLLPAPVEFTYLIARCVFDKKKFPKAQRLRIKFLSQQVDDELKHALLSKVFFAFTPVLLDAIASECWEEILQLYLRFGEY